MGAGSTRQPRWQVLPPKLLNGAQAGGGVHRLPTRLPRIIAQVSTDLTRSPGDENWTRRDSQNAMGVMAANSPLSAAFLTHGRPGRSRFLRLPPESTWRLFPRLRFEGRSG